MKYPSRLRHILRAGQVAELRVKKLDDEPLEFAVGDQPKILGTRCHVAEIREQDLQTVTDREAERSGYENRGALFQALGYIAAGPNFEVPIWVIVLKPEEHIRLLHRDSSHGYTENRHLALQDEPEAVSDADLQRYAEDAQLIAGQQAEIYNAAWERQSLVRRLEKIVNDPSTEPAQLASLRKRIEQIERRAQRKAA